MAAVLYLVIPCYNEEQVLPITSGKFKAKLEELIGAGKISDKSRVMFVNDGSKDSTWDIITSLTEADPMYCAISLSRNRGHQNALIAGLMEAKRFAEFTGCDALAIAVGTSHGAYKFKPQLDFERIEKIASMIDAPLVLHGGSGLSDDDFRRAIACGISKINIFTDLNVACLKAAHDAYAAGKGMTDVMGAMSLAVKEATMKKMLLFGSNGRA